MKKLYTHTSSRYWRNIFGVLLVCVSVNVSAQSLFGSESDEEEMPVVKKEIPVVLPPFPEEENLLIFDVSPTQTQTFSIDSKSLTIAGDEIRYTLVSTSPSGAKNISYEGLRCATNEVHSYAYGYKTEWSLSRSDKWRPIQFYAANRPHAALVQDYFCADKMIVGKPEDMLQRIRYKRSLMRERYNSGR